MSARRDRALPSFADAWRLWREALDAAGLPQRLVSERVALTDAVGRVPARVERTRRPSPTYRAAAMDGFAVHAADVARAAPNRPVRLKVGSRAIPVDTGEAVPDGFDAVIPIEDTIAAGDEIAIAAGIDAGKNVRLPGDDVPPGVAIGWPGRPLRPLDCAALLAGGCTTADVVRRPTVTVIPTGDELVAPGTAARPGAVIESNSAMIACEARLLGAVVHVRTALGDDEARLAGALREAIAASDVVLLLAGSSSGRRDRAAAAIENAGTIVVRGVAMRPARPVILGHAGRVAIVNLPGYPVSCHLAFDAFVAPLLRRLSGVPDTAPRRGRLAEEIAVDATSDEWRPVTLFSGPGSPRAILQPVADLGGHLFRLSAADARAHLKPGVPRYGRHVAVPWSPLRDADAAALPVFVGPYDPLIEELAALAGFRCRWTADETGEALDEGLADAVGVLVRAGNASALRARAGAGRKMLAIGVRSEGIAARTREATQMRRTGATRGADPWAAAAAVASGIVEAAQTTRFVAERYDLAFTETDAVAYACVWEDRPGHRFPWGIALPAALSAVAEAAPSLGWKSVGTA